MLRSVARAAIRLGEWFLPFAVGFVLSTAAVKPAVGVACETRLELLMVDEVLR